MFEIIYLDPLTPAYRQAGHPSPLWGEVDVEEEGRNYEQG